MGKVIPLPGMPRSWTAGERVIFARILHFYNRSNLKNNYVYTEEGITEDSEPWIAFVCHDGTTILSLTKMQINHAIKFVVLYRSKYYEFDDLVSFTVDFMAENLWAESGTRS
ncbi:MAG: hypothetical protein VW802_09615 [Rhodospirillaceae bacterium]|jgi:hypothetical protein